MRLARNQQLAIAKWNKDNNVQKNVHMSVCKKRKYNFSKRFYKINYSFGKPSLSNASRTL